MRQPKPIPIERHAPPRSGRVAWTAEPKASPFTGFVPAEEKGRARRELELAIRADGFDADDCDFVWQPIEAGWGWTAKLREDALMT